MALWKTMAHYMDYKFTLNNIKKSSNNLVAFKLPYLMKL